MFPPYKVYLINCSENILWKTPSDNNNNNEERTPLWNRNLFILLINDNIIIDDYTLDNKETTCDIKMVT